MVWAPPPQFVILPLAAAAVAQASPRHPPETDAAAQDGILLGGIIDRQGVSGVGYGSLHSPETDADAAASTTSRGATDAAPGGASESVTAAASAIAEPKDATAAATLPAGADLLGGRPAPRPSGPATLTPPPPRLPGSDEAQPNSWHHTGT